ncbi:hypothetical protein EB796_020310 [Bugula neritina]|uniref:Uncharacterized protein n=1 Tax=Bugula neritina TaxID=10212 RepID=A0A7J7J659_BUGNE|nr:hypothetical protein EB796_020310 [Bugula neritina]
MMDPPDTRVDYMNKSYDLVWKVVLIGDSGVGKTNFLTRYAWDQFTQESRTTIGIDFACRDVVHDGKKIKLQIWDTAGQERFRVLAHLYYSRAVAVIVLYDITKHTSFQDVSERWLAELKESSNLEDPVLILIGHKSDLRHVRSVTTEEGESLAAKHDMIFLEASAQDNINIDETFKKLVAAVSNKQRFKRQQPIETSFQLESQVKTSPGKTKKKTCC